MIRTLSRSFSSPPTPSALPNIQHVIAVASGKGGVGKSTVSANLACALSARGARVGLLDADVYGPSIPTLLGLDADRPDVDDSSSMVPKSAHGIVANSMGFLVDPGAPIVWRGLMVMSALEQLIFKTAWGTLDYLIVDMPPGTGDAQLTLSQRVSVTAALVVSTPQEMSLVDARRAIAMFDSVGIPVAGLVENMASSACPSCGTVSDIFGAGGVAAEATRANLDFLASIPLAASVRVTSDAGSPLAARTGAEATPEAAPYFAIADAVLRKHPTG